MWKLEARSVEAKSAHLAEWPRHPCFHHECSPCCYENDLPLAQKLVLNNNPNISNGKSGNLKVKMQLASNQHGLRNIYKLQVLMHLHPESDLELNRKDIETFLRFPTVICIPHEKWFRSYEFWKSTRLLKSCSGQNWVSREVSTFDSKSNAISINFQYQYCSYLSQLSNGHSYASIRLTTHELWSLKFVSGYWKLWFEPNGVTSWLRDLDLIKIRSGETLNIEVVRNFHRLSKEVGNSELRYWTKEPWTIEFGRILEIWLQIWINF
jgi:hypothetical protein